MKAELKQALDDFQSFMENAPEPWQLEAAAEALREVIEDVDNRLRKVEARLSEL